MIGCSEPVGIGVALHGPHAFRPHERLHSSPAYQRVRKIGRRARSPHFWVNSAPNGLDHHRLGLVVQKRFWSAVGRNRIKRCLREWFRQHKAELPLPGKDFVVVARPGAERLSSPDLARELLAAVAH